MYVGWTAGFIAINVGQTVNLSISFTRFHEVEEYC